MGGMVSRNTTFPDGVLSLLFDQICLLMSCYLILLAGRSMLSVR